MTRARALVAAVPPRVWASVAGLALLASLGVGLVLTAGLSTWQGAVGPAPNPRAGGAPATVVSPPRSAVIVVPTPAAARPHVPATVAVAAGQTQPGSAPVAAVPGVPTVVAGLPTAVAPPVAPAAPAAPAGPSAQPRAVGLTPSASAPAHGHGHAATKAKPHRGNHGKHLGWTKGVRGAGHGQGKGAERMHRR